MITDEMVASLRAKAQEIRDDYKRIRGHECDCYTTVGALEYGRAQGIEMAIDVIAALSAAPQPVAVPDGQLVFDTSRNVSEEDIEQWAALRADDAGYLARKLVATRRPTPPYPASRRATMQVSETAEYTLRAMANNYTGGHSWDNLDSEACLRAADEIRSLRAALSAAPQPVAVKPLEWKTYRADLRNGTPTEIHGFHEFGSYTLSRNGAAWFVGSFDNMGRMRPVGGIGGFKDKDTAKAAAQADYEQRIRSALVAAPQPDGWRPEVRKFMDTYRAGLKTLAASELYDFLSALPAPPAGGDR